MCPPRFVYVLARMRTVRVGAYDADMDGSVGLRSDPRPTWETVQVIATWIVSLGIVVAQRSIVSLPVVPPMEHGLTIAIALVPLVLSAVVVRARPHHTVGPLLAYSGFVALAVASLDADRLGAFAGLWMFLYVPLGLILIVVPSGNPLTPRWAWVGRALVFTPLVFTLSGAADNEAHAGEPLFTVAGVALLVAFLVLLVLCMLAPLARFRRGIIDDRSRVQWIFLAGMTLPGTLLLCWLSYLLTGGPDLVILGLIAMFLAIPVCATIAILRPDIADVDRAAVATVTAYVLSVGALIILSAVCAIAGTVLIDWSPVAAAIVIAVLVTGAVLAFSHVRKVIERVIYPENSRAILMLQELTQAVAQGRSQPDQVQDVLRSSLGDPGIEIAVASHSSDESADQTGTGLTFLNGSTVVDSDRQIPVRMRGELVGAIVLSPNTRVVPSTTVLALVAPLIEALRTEQLITHARSQVEQSRERMLRAGYEERRKLERDLHDGVQQRLVAVGMQLRVLQRTGTLPPSAHAALDEAVAEVGTTISELRSIAHGIRPSVLSDGLDSALGSLARLAPREIELDVQIPNVPDVVATTAYFVASEAVTNALRHSGATMILISANVVTDHLVISVRDNGTGGAQSKPMGGLAGLADRVSAIHGTFCVESSAETGTLVEARLPCA